MIVEKTILEKLKLKLKNDLLYMGENRSIIVTTKSFSSLRKDLIRNIGLERMKGFFSATAGNSAKKMQES